jgi:hypothetical protein
MMAGVLARVGPVGEAGKAKDGGPDRLAGAS